MALPDKLDLYFDGSCNRPGGIAGYAWQLICQETQDILASDCGQVCSGPKATNNVGEWGAVRNGLRYLNDQGWSGELHIYGDSQIVIYQLLGQYKCRKDTLIPYYRECMILLEPFKFWRAHWIPRKENWECDEMSKTYLLVPKNATLVSASGEANTRKRKVSGDTAKVSRRNNAGNVEEFSRPNIGEETPEVSFD